MKAASTSTRLAVPVSERDHVRGPDAARITLVEYGDYECKYCRAVHPIIEQLRDEFGDEVRYIFRNFPLTTMHPHARMAAEAAEAAGAQGKFWEMHDRLLESRGLLRPLDLQRYAAEIGLDVEEFQADLDAHAYATRVRDDFRSGRESGVNGTPTFFINDRKYEGAWDYESLRQVIAKPVAKRIKMLAAEFMRISAAGGIVLLLCTILVLLLANSPLAENYFHLLEMELAITLGAFHLGESLLHWVNDGLMAMFFFVVGLEIKREVTVGELASLRKAALPVAGAIGGMLFPALIYSAFNLGGPGASGWGVPMATDIAFTLGVLALLGRRVPLSLRVFFTALAIADDLGAVLVLALFYTSEVSFVALGIGAIFLVLLIGLNRARVMSPFPYWILGLGLWLAFLESGIHPTLAGVLLATTIPTRSPPNTRALLAQVIAMVAGFGRPEDWDDHDDDSRYQSVVQTFETVTDRLQSPAQRLERDLQPWTAFVILPIFALANAGVVLDGGALSTLFSPVSLGIMLGLIVGKPLGISLLSWLAVRMGWAELPAGVSWSQFVSASVLAGIGFTMSLFIANAAYTDAAVLAQAKTAILVGSVLAGLVGWVALSKSCLKYSEHTLASAADSGETTALPA